MFKPFFDNELTSEVEEVDGAVDGGFMSDFQADVRTFFGSFYRFSVYLHFGYGLGEEISVALYQQNVADF